MVPLPSVDILFKKILLISVLLIISDDVHVAHLKFPDIQLGNGLQF